MNNEIELKNLDPKPFLRWAGGKRWFIKYLKSISNLEVRNYFEPFLGGASVFFSMKSFQNAYLSDLNYELIETYESIRDSPLEVISILKTLKNTQEEYYRIRSGRYEDKIQRAVQFIYLNQTSFNGIYRVNQKGEFNVPFGNRKKKDLVEELNLISVSKKLQNVNLSCRDFEDLLPSINEGDFLFLDPPYTVAHENNGFIQYNQKIFSLEDQYRLANFLKSVIDKKANFVLTNAKHDAILEIYKDIGEPISLTRSSTVGGTGARRGKQGFNEYIYSNCLTLKK